LSIDDGLFARLTGGLYADGCAFLDEATDHLPAKFRDDFDLDSKNEFCLPVKASMRAFLRWSERMELISKPDGLPTFLSHVVRTVPYYRKLLQRRASPPLTLSTFPVMSKAEMIENYCAFISESYHADDQKLFKQTSGTTGTPLVVWFDAESFYDLNYQTYRRVARHLPGLLESLTPEATAAIQLTDNPATWPGSTMLPSLNLSRLYRQIFGMQGIDNDRVIARVRACQPPLICGMASSLLQYLALEKAALPGAPTCHPRAIFLSGETLFDNGRALLQSWFNCPVISAYTSTEGGLIAMECLLTNGLHLYSDHVRVELLDGSGSLAEEGDGEIVVTNLLNWAFPFVRYRTGDRATVRSVLCECGFRGMTITKLHGREATRFQLPGRDVDVGTLDQVFSRLPLIEFRLEQQAPNRFTFKWVPADAREDPGPLEDEIGSILRMHLGDVAVSSARTTRITEPGTKARRYVACDPA
jgi:phenylacetate-coenzyme A ligase PaaK-like adenylate-forming protein